jgi:hypothetical protein
MTLPPPLRRKLTALRQTLKRRKAKHRKSAACERPRTCGGCHFYSGYIQALDDILGDAIPAAPVVYVGRDILGDPRRPGS